ncbi:MAG: BON domain-containing protein [Terriglobales bacterium]
MKSNTKFAAILMAAIMSLGGLALADTGSDAALQAKLAAELQKKSEFKNVQSSVSDGVVTLQGTVDSYKHKLDAEKKARKQSHNVRDEISVAGPEISDAALRDKLAKKLAYDRVGYGKVWNVLTVGVDNGVATVGGEVRNPVDRESAIAEVVNTPGVKGVVNQVKVAPASFYDDRVRFGVACAIYRDPALSRYSLDPQAPIRIVVDGGHVGLYGVVMDNFDRNVAFIRASAVPGVFSVENHLQTDKEVAR